MKKRTKLFALVLLSTLTLKGVTAFAVIQPPVPNSIKEPIVLLSIDPPVPN